MDNLKKIQTVMKVFKILTKIGFVACIVGGSLCLLMLLLLFLADVVGIMDREIAMSMMSPKDAPVAVAYCVLFVGICQTFFGALIAHKWNSYYKMEEEDGTPFVEKSAKFLFSTAIYELILGFVAFVVSSVIVAVFEATHADVNFSHDMKFSFDAVTVLFTLFLSIVFRYGAEVRENK